MAPCGPSDPRIAFAIMTTQHIQAEYRDGVLKLTLDRPDVLNSFNARMAAELATALQGAANDSATRAVLLTGIGRAFCAGQDLAEVMPDGDATSTDLGEVVERQYNPIVRAIRQTEKPFVCAVNGVAAGAGANIAFACDIVLAAEGATFIQSFSKIGLIPDSGGTYHLPRLVGLQRANWLAMLGEKLDANRARDWGLIYDVVPAAALADTSFDLARRLASMPTRALGLIKRAFNASAHNDLEAQLALEMELQREAGRTEDYAEGVRAFIEKRKPRFQGR
jgi:2-(1,2-epoxy-1,2-dihydrophenyl)acetyl-CoA isomerase